jgi:hypothetical protein
VHQFVNKRLWLHQDARHNCENYKKFVYPVNYLTQRDFPVENQKLMFYSFKIVHPVVLSQDWLINTNVWHDYIFWKSLQTKYVAIMKSTKRHSCFSGFCLLTSNILYLWHQKMLNICSRLGTQKLIVFQYESLTSLQMWTQPEARQRECALTFKTGFTRTRLIHWPWISEVVRSTFNNKYTCAVYLTINLHKLLLLRNSIQFQNIYSSVFWSPNWRFSRLMEHGPQPACELIKFMCRLKKKILAHRGERRNAHKILVREPATLINIF